MSQNFSDASQTRFSRSAGHPDNFWARSEKKALVPFGKWQTLLLAVLATAIMLLGWGTYVSQQHNFREQKNNELFAISKLKSNEISKWLAERSADAEVMRASPLFPEAMHHWLMTGDAKERNILERRLTGIYQANHYQSVAVVDVDGIVLLQVGEPLLVTGELRPYGNFIFKKGVISFSETPL